MKVLKIGAVWCNGCVVMGPRWKKVEEENPWLETEYFEYDESPMVVKKYKVEQGRLPVFIFLDKSGKEIDRRNGEISEKEITTLIAKYRDN